MSGRALLGLIVIGLLCAIGTVLFGLNHDDGPKRPPNKDPQHGAVIVANDGRATTRKFCDGTTLVYVTHSAKSTSNSVVPNSEECK